MCLKGLWRIPAAGSTSQQTGTFKAGNTLAIGLGLIYGAMGAKHKIITYILNINFVAFSLFYSAINFEYLARLLFKKGLTD